MRILFCEIYGPRLGFLIITWHSHWEDSSIRQPETRWSAHQASAMGTFTSTQYKFSNINECGMGQLGLWYLTATKCIEILEEEEIDLRKWAKILYDTPIERIPLPAARKHTEQLSGLQPWELSTVPSASSAIDMSEEWGTGKRIFDCHWKSMENMVWTITIKLL